MIILNRFNSSSILPLNFSECSYLTELFNFLAIELSDDYGFHVLYPGAPFNFNRKTKYNVAIHISNEVNYDNKDYHLFDYVFRFYLSSRCDYIKVFPINIGYNSSGFKNIGVPFFPESNLIDRQNDAFFFGNKTVRMSFYKSMLNLKNNYDISFTNSYRSGLELIDFRKKLGSSKICFAPGGVSPESFRYTEAFASGCIVITDFYSDVWYMKGSPSIHINDWKLFSENHISDILDYLHLGDYKERALCYYNTMLSAKANSDYIIRILSTK